MAYKNAETKRAYQTPYMIIWREKNREHHRSWMREWATRRRKNPAKRKMDIARRDSEEMKEKYLNWSRQYRKNNPDYEKKRSQNLERGWIIKQLKKKKWPVTEETIISYLLILKIKRYVKQSTRN